MRTTLILNAKGGSGKTTISTNLAGYLASLGRAVVLQDYDPQASCTEWLEQRSFQLNQIHGQKLFKAGSQFLTRAFQFRLPAHTDHVIVDTPAALDLQRNLSTIRKAEKIIIPVSASALDVRATLHFIAELKKFDKNSTAFKMMKQKFTSEDIEFITELSDHEYYYIAAESGASIFELENPMVAKDKFEWAPLVNWIEGKTVEKTAAEPSSLFAVAD